MGRAGMSREKKKELRKKLQLEQFRWLLDLDVTQKYIEKLRSRKKNVGYGHD